MLLLNKIQLALLSLLIGIALPSYASFEHCIQGYWEFDKKQSDNPKRVLKKLRRKLKKQHDRRYYRQKPVEEGQNFSLPDNLPVFVFSESPLEITFSDNYWELKSSDLLRKVPLEGVQKSYSLAQYSQSTYTYLASVNDEKLIIDSATSFDLYVQEQYQLLDSGALQIDVTISLSNNKPLRLQRFFNKHQYEKECL